MNKFFSYYKKALTPPYKRRDIPVIALSFLVILLITTFFTINFLQKGNTDKQSHAQTINTFEPENGTTTGNTIIISDPNASGGKYTVLGTTPTPTQDTTPVNDPFINMVTSPAPAGSGNLAAILGLNSHYTNNDAGLDKAKAAGFSWIRKDLTWGDIEKTKGVYDFSAYDYLMNSLTARGMKPLFILDYGNNLYTQNYMSVRTDAERTAFGNFAEAAARHFAGRGVRWEIWNEPDGTTFWLPTPNANEYAALAKSVLPRVRAGDPAGLITTGGLGMFDRDFFPPMLAAGAANGYDAVAVHTYWMPGGPEEVFNQLTWWQSVKNQYGVGALPDWMTEFGYDINGDMGGGNIGGDQTKYAAWTTRLILSDWAAGFKLIIVYDTDFNGQGLLNAPNQLGYQAVSTLSQIAQGRTFTNFIVPGDNTQLNALRMVGPSDVTYVFWMRSGSKTVQIPQGATVKDMLGKSITPSGGQLTLTATQGPVYVAIPK